MNLLSGVFAYLAIGFALSVAISIFNNWTTGWGRRAGDEFVSFRWTIMAMWPVAIVFPFAYLLVCCFENSWVQGWLPDPVGRLSDLIVDAAGWRNKQEGPDDEAVALRHGFSLSCSLDSNERNG